MFNADADTQVFGAVESSKSARFVLAPRIAQITVCHCISQPLAVVLGPNALDIQAEATKVTLTPSVCLDTILLLQF